MFNNNVGHVIRRGDDLTIDLSLTMLYLMLFIIEFGLFIVRCDNYTLGQRRTDEVLLKKITKMLKVLVHRYLLTIMKVDKHSTEGDEIKRIRV
jgi:hypothetical protein